MRDTREVRASGLKGDSSPAIIEIIDDDTNMFGDRVPNTTIYDTGGPRWVGPVAATVLLALMGYGVATSASSSGVPKVAPAPSTIAPPPIIHPAPSTTLPAPLVPYYAADPPRQFSVGYAGLQELDKGYYGTDKYQLWVTDGATASSGSWFSIESNRDVRQMLYALDAYRVQSGEQSIAISHLATGQSIAQLSVNRATAVTLTAFGWSDEDLVRLAQSVTVRGDTAVLGDPSLIAGYQMISTIQPWLALQGIPVEQITYESADDISGGVKIAVAPRPASGQGGATLDRQIALKFFLDHPTTFGVDGHVAVAGSVIGAHYSVATWIAGDHIVTLTSAMPVQQLIDIAGTVHQISSDEWDGMRFQAARHNADNNFGNFDQTQPVPVSYGTDAAAQQWTIQVAVAKYPHQQQVTWSWNGAGFGTGFGSTAESTARINTVVDDQRTYVLADLPRTVASTAQLQIILAGLDPVTVPFADTDPTFDRTFAAYAFSEPTQYTAQIVGPDGTVLATWPSS